MQIKTFINHLIHIYKRDLELSLRLASCFVGSILFAIILVCDYSSSGTAQSLVERYSVEAATVLLILLFCIEFLYYKKSQWLSYTIQKELTHMLKKEGYYWKHMFRKHILRHAREYGHLVLWLIGSAAFGFIVVLLLTIFSPHSDHVWLWQVTVDAGFIRDAVQLLATVFTVAIAIIIFAAESAQRVKPQFMSLYFKRTNITPVIFIGIASVVVLFSKSYLNNGSSAEMNGITSSLVFSIVVLNIPLIGFLFLNFIKVQRRYYDVVFESILNEMRENLHNDVSERIQMVVLMNEGDKYNFFSHGSSEREGTVLKAYRDGVISDVNMKILQRISQRISKPGTTTHAFSVATIGNRVRKGKDVLISFVGNQSIEYPARRIFKIKPWQEKAKEVGFEALKKLTIDAIENDDEGQLRRFLDVYKELAVAYIDELHQLGFRFNKKQVSEFGSFKLYFHDYLQEHFEEFIRHAVFKRNDDFVRTIIFVARLILDDAVEKNNLLMFRQMSHLFPRLYYISHQIDASEHIKKLIRHEVCSWSKETVKFTLQRELELLDTVDDVKQFQSFMEMTTETYSSLGRAAIERADKDSLAVIDTHVSDLLDESGARTYVPDDELVKEYLEKKVISQDKAEQYRFERVKKEFFDSSVTYRNFMWYGFGGWLVNLLNHGRMKDEELRSRSFEILSTILTKFDVKLVNQIYGELRKSHDACERNDFGWQFWSLVEHEPGVIYSSVGSRDGWLDNVYILWILSHIQLGADNTQLLAPSKGIKYDNDGLLNIANRFKAQKDLWGGLLGEQIEEKVEEFGRLYAHAKAEQARIESQWLISQPLSETKTNGFIEKIKESHRKAAFMRKVFVMNGGYKDLTSQDTDYDNMYYIARFLNKEMFVDGWDSDFIGYEEMFGTPLANTENHLLLAPILSNADKIEYTSNAQIFQVIDNLIQHMKNKSINPQVILVPALRWEDEKDLVENHLFTPKHQTELFPEYKDLNEFRGLYGGIPLFELNSIFLNKYVAVADVTRFGCLEQLKIKNLTGQTFEFIIETLNEEKIRAEKDKDMWRRGDDGVRLTDEQVIEKMKKHVSVVASEKFQVQVKDGRAVSACLFPKAMGKD